MRCSIRPRVFYEFHGVRGELTPPPPRNYKAVMNNRKWVIVVIWLLPGCFTDTAQDAEDDSAAAVQAVEAVVCPSSGPGLYCEGNVLWRYFYEDGACLRAPEAVCIYGCHDAGRGRNDYCERAPSPSTD